MHTLNEPHLHASNETSHMSKKTHKKLPLYLESIRNGRRLRLPTVKLELSNLSFYIDPLYNGPITDEQQLLVGGYYSGSVFTVKNGIYVAGTRRFSLIIDDEY